MTAVETRVRRAATVRPSTSDTIRALGGKAHAIGRCARRCGKADSRFGRAIATPDFGVADSGSC